MKPAYHLMFGFAVTLGFFAVFLPDQISWPVVFLASVSGFLPDFDHREWIWKLVALGLFVGFFLLFADSLYAFFPADPFIALFVSAAASGILSWVIYAAHPFSVDILSLSDNKLQFSGAEGWFLAVYVLIVFAATLSPVIALAALIGYSSHWVLDYLAYYTFFGRKYLVHYPHPERGPAWQVRRIQDEEPSRYSRHNNAAEEAKKRRKSAQAKNGGIRRFSKGSLAED